MLVRHQGYTEYQGEYGQTRRFVSANKSTIHFQPGRDGVTLEWSTLGPPLVPLHTVLADEVIRHRPKRCILMFKWDVEYHHRDWRGIWEKFSDSVANDLDGIQYVRFDFPTRSIANTSLLPHFGVGLSYEVYRTSLRPNSPDIQALREAFMATAEPSIKPELDWVIESLIS